MSEETARALEKAEAALSERRQLADEEKSACLRVVAQGLAARVDAVAKRMAQEQPDVTKSLGATGVAALRSDLANYSAELATYVEGAADEIEWPESTSVYDKVEARKVHSALFRLLHGSKMKRIDGILNEHGYVIRGNLLPQDLYSEQDFRGVAVALNDLSTAEREHAKAKAEDDRDTVESIWGES